MERVKMENARKTRMFWGFGNRKQGLSALPPRLTPQMQLCQGRRYECFYDCYKPMNSRAGDRGINCL